MRTLLCIVGVVTLFLSLAVAQTTTGDIRGIVRDPSGAVVSNATVEIKNVDQNAVLRTLKTGADGTYVASLLPVGRYEVRVTAPGFESFLGTLTLNVNDRRTVDVALKVGTQGNTVDVKESPVQVDLNTPEAAGLMTGTQIRELAVLSRNFVQLVALQPGVTTDMATDQMYVGASNPTGFSNQINISVNGNRPTQNNWLIDGADNVDRGANLTLLSYPSIDSIAEFKVLRSNYLPEHGRSSSGEVTVVTRGGTNDFHGTLYEFFRHDKLNANNYFNKLNELDNGLPNGPERVRWNDFGFTVGGPIVKNHTFFFYSQEWRKFGISTTNTSGQLPTAAEMAGAFPTPVCVAFDASGNCTGTGTQISNIDPVASAYVKDIYSKLPAVANSGDTLTFLAYPKYDYREESVRIDQNIGNKFTLFGRYTDDHIPTYEPLGLYTGNPLPGVSSTQTNAPGRNFAAHATWTISPSLLDEMSYAFAWGAVLSNPVGSIARKNSPDINPTLPYASSAATVPLLSFDYVNGLQGFGAYNDYNKNHTATDNLSWVRGKHALKFGATFNHYTKDEDSNNYPSFYISAAAPGSPSDDTFEQNWANFLLGRVSSFSQAQNLFRYLVVQNQWEFYAQDEWRVRPNLTIDYGVRYSLFLAPYFGNNMLSTFDANLYDRSKAPAIDPTTGLYTTSQNVGTLTGLVQGGKNSPFGRAVVPSQKNLWAPRLGFAWDPTGQGRTSVRGGFGLFYDSPAINNHELNQEFNPSVSNSASYFNTSLSDPSGSTPPNFTPPVVYGPNAAYWKQPYSMMFNLDVQHQITPSTMFDIGYFGNLGRHLMGIVDVNMPKPLAFQQIPGYCGTTPTNTCTFNAFDYQLLNSVRPYQGYDALNLFTPAFTSNYNGLQASFQKQFSSNSQIQVNYTWSHALTTASGDYRAAQDTYNLRGDYGNADFDRRHVLTASYVYLLPWFKNQDGLKGHILGGWELSGVVYLNSGRHYTATYSSCSQDRAGLGLCGNTWSGARPDMNGDPNANAPNTISEWFNTSVFSRVPATEPRVGNEPRGTIVGPGTKRWDASIFKNTKIGERFSTQFRAEFFNALNNVNLGWGSPASAFASLNARSSLFGKIVNARDPRQIQFGMKLFF